MPNESNQVIIQNWPHYPLTDSTVWHYTGADGLLGILDSNTLWATSPRVLNDTSELKYGIDFILQEKAQLLSSANRDLSLLVERAFDFDIEADIANSVFVVCASTEPDLLNQWMHYAGLDGFAIGLRTRDLLSQKGYPTSAQKSLTDQIARQVPEGWVAVSYSPEQQRRLISECFEDLKTLHRKHGKFLLSNEELWMGVQRFRIKSLAVQLKHPAFTDEKEWRYVSGTAAGAKYRVAGGHLVPYVEVGRMDEASEYTQARSLPLVEVMCGPGARPGTESIVSELLESKNYTDVKVTLSGTPPIAR